MSSAPRPTPRIGFHLTTFSASTRTDWSAQLALAEAADRAGIDRLSVSDHVVMGDDLSSYANPATGGVAGGKQPTGPDGDWLEPLTVLSFVASRTRRIRLATNILLVALRRPVVLAKTIATLDVLSGGRVDLGVGVGWQKAEYDAAGLAFADRGRQLDEALTICQALWRERSASYSVGDTQAAGIHQMPKPVQPGGVPIWVSGTVNRRSMARLARFGSGWIPWGADAADVVAAIPKMRAAVQAAGGDPSGLRVIDAVPMRGGDGAPLDPDEALRNVPAAIEAGVTDFTIRLPQTEDSIDETIAALPAWAEAFRRIAG